VVCIVCVWCVVCIYVLCVCDVYVWVVCVVCGWSLYSIAKKGDHGETVKTLWSLGAVDEQEGDGTSPKSLDLKKTFYFQ